MIPPGSTIGILGSGQLGRMLALAAAPLGYRVHIFAPAAECATDVVADVTRGAYDDFAALDAFAAKVDVVTYEFENVDVAAVAHLAERLPIHPDARVLEISQDRLNEKRFIESLGGRPAPFRAVDDLAGLEVALVEIGTPAILKTRRMGYDGKGQVRISNPAEAAEAWAATGGHPCVLEALVRFDAEFSVLLARGADGDMRLYDIPENRHAAGIASPFVITGAANHNHLTGHRHRAAELFVCGWTRVINGNHRDFRIPGRKLKNVGGARVVRPGIVAVRAHQ